MVCNSFLFTWFIFNYVNYFILLVSSNITDSLTDFMFDWILLC